MATVKIKGIDRLKVNTQKILTDVKTDAQTLNDIGELLRDEVIGFTRSGKSVSTNGSFPQLADSTIKSRKNLSKYNQTDALYSPARSNLTFTGELLESLTIKTKVREGSVEVLPQGNHKGYKTKTGRGKSELNRDIFDWLEAKGFKVFGFSQAFRDRLSSRVNVLIKRTLRKKY